MKRLLSKVTFISLLASSLFSVSPAGAVGVTVTITPSSSSTSPQATTVQWVRGAATTYAAGTTIVISVAPAMTDVTSTTQLIDLDGAGGTDTEYTTSTCSVSACDLTYTVVTTTASVTTFSAPVTLTFGATAQNYSVSVYTSAPVDFGSALFYANGGNLVNVSANVPATLSFSIRNTADTANTNACALGTLTTGAVNTCVYRLRIGTNAASGFAATIQANHDLGTGTATMTQIGDNVAFAAGTEAYGIQVLTGATAGGRNTGTGAYDQPVTEGTAANFTFQTDTSPVPTSTAPTIVSYVSSFDASSAPSLTNTSLVQHAAAINGGTAAGNYTQTITYIVTASF